MKKNYIAPAFYCFSVHSVTMLASSITQTISSISIEDGGAELGSKSNDQWSDIWE